ncbi:MAG: RNA-binding S4 domain-containing protein [Burkholderiales bacterium]|nr:RNA-binding S4 domain-containing protein [Burkholderiales bacterium]
MIDIPNDNAVPFELRGEYIELAALLKATGIATSGASAKVLITEGAVLVNGQPETRRARKLRAGDEVQFATHRVRVLST